MAVDLELVLGNLDSYSVQSGRHEKTSLYMLRLAFNFNTTELSRTAQSKRDLKGQSQFMPLMKQS